ncbi:tRNA 5-methoxyuridine(34)/uridine 5-oxyacetic acid(34) synthase CmoB [Idiomarina tyrosinivorans]|uniref:tRNA U34 carboxymethyltransferase n=1 Tax=Idiomarina tyrosinivorans TaxID=1445662 RepID=A0A432ZPJ6_9GAMM|nr:tRNA 5-methoxyuridine(34)/uridine 5-oxyacetic acid(34) synthase CmoB [Idiomarina tyrosinivorans]RUO79781.1 tRNA 5-methoxyuridine(34)/uridine 5-oxyacetic acid(34) synthase CmoB [Idiomarina tyrosinivorans]
MKEFSDSLAALIASPHQQWITTLPQQLQQLYQQRHPDSKKWLRAVAQLPDLSSEDVALADTVRIGNEQQATDAQRAQLKGLLSQLIPWRKGPYNLFGLTIDTEWRSDLKWQRLVNGITSLQGKQVLDVGCGSGYHLWRMLEAGAEQVWGIDPGDLFLQQFRAIKGFMPKALQQRAHFFPVGVETLPPLASFDSVFCMGVLYHRRSPIDCLEQLKSVLKPSGELVLETLVVTGDKNTVLVPGERYAQMRNVWFLPSTAALCHWLSRLGFKDIKVIDESQTTIEEQRATEWMTGESLADFLDPNDHNLTIEGYQAPIRAVVTAKK